MSQDDLYREAAATHAAALSRIARAYELDSDKRRDLLQEIHLALWRSFANFEGRCSLVTWVFRVAHNTGISHVVRQLRSNLKNLVSLEEITESADPADPADHSRNVEQRIALDRLLRLVHRLNPVDRQLMLLYLEDLDGASIAEITGFSPGNVRLQIHRIKVLLARRFHEGGVS